jgi:hypothetical protein
MIVDFEPGIVEIDFEEQRATRIDAQDKWGLKEAKVRSATKRIPKVIPNIILMRQRASSCNSEFY